MKVGAGAAAAVSAMAAATVASMSGVGEGVGVGIASATAASTLAWMSGVGSGAGDVQAAIAAAEIAKRTIPKPTFRATLHIRQFYCPMGHEFDASRRGREVIERISLLIFGGSQTRYPKGLVLPLKGLTHTQPGR